MDSVVRKKTHLGAGPETQGLDGWPSYWQCDGYPQQPWTPEEVSELSITCQLPQDAGFMCSLLFRGLTSVTTKLLQLRSALGFCFVWLLVFVLGAFRGGKTPVCLAQQQRLDRYDLIKVYFHLFSVFCTFYSTN